MDTKKKKATVVGDKKPATQAKIVIRNLIITLLFAAVYFYVALPAINLHNPEFYGFFFILSAIFCVLSIISNAAIRTETDGKEVWKKIKQSCAVPLIICAGLVLLFIFGSLLSSVILRSGSYKQLITVTKSDDFAGEVAEVSFDRIPMLDKDSATRLGDRKLGELEDMVSQFEVLPNYTQINYKSRPVRVATLAYGDLFKWFGNMSDGLPAYIIIDMVTQNAEVVRLSEGMKYSTADHFGRNINMHMRFNYPTFMFGNVHFEIDESGQPYWVCPRIERTIGLFGGTDINGVVLVNAVTGECEYVTDVPTWVDAVYDAALIIEQYDYYGQYQNGFLNSLFGQKGVSVTTAGYNYVAMNDDVYVYTGITSVGGDESNIGFILCNQRTKETRYYTCAGAEEYSAMESAQGIVQHLQYSATFPLLLNVASQPTYFMSLKDQAGLVKMYAMVNVQQYNIVASGQTVAECEADYLKLLANNGIGGGDLTPSSEISGRVTDARAAVIDGMSYYYFSLDTSGDVYYRVSAKDSESAVMINVGDEVSIIVSGGAGQIVHASSIAKK